MSTDEHYFTFPLAVLHGPSPLECLQRALCWGMHSAGIGLLRNHGHGEFRERLDEACAKAKITGINPESDEAKLVVGASVCGGVTLGYSPSCLKGYMEWVSKVKAGPPFVRMKSSFLWAAVSEQDPDIAAQKHTLSWREFRVLCALLSAPVNRRGYCFLGWEPIQTRSCGHASKAAHRQDPEIREHLSPLTRKQIRLTLDTLEELNFFARFHFSSGRSGGLTAYSFRLSREELGKAVCADVNFRDRSGTARHRQEDAAVCAQLLVRANRGEKGPRGANKGPSQVQGDGQV